MDFLKNIENTIENTIENMLNNYTEQDLEAGFKKSRTQSDEQDLVNPARKAGFKKSRTQSDEEYYDDEGARKSSVHRTQPLRWTDSLVENTENENENENEQDLENPARKSDEEYSDNEQDLENPARKSDEEYSDNEQDLEYSNNKGARESSIQRAEPSRGAEVIITEPKSSNTPSKLPSIEEKFNNKGARGAEALAEISNTLKKYVRTISKVNIPETIPESIQEFALENISANTPTNADYNKSRQLMPFTPKRNPDYTPDERKYDSSKPDGSKPDGSKPNGSKHDGSKHHHKSKLPFNETYVIFLPDCFFIYSWYSYRYYRKIITNLRNKGIKVINILKMVKYQEAEEDSSLLFDDNKYPDPNILYIHLFNGLYYNDTVFNKRKIEKERDMLLLLAGKLGVSSIRFNTQITETTLVNIGASLKAKGFENGAKYTKNVKSYGGNSGIETYANSGSAIYITSSDLNEFDDNIKDTLSALKSNIFNYDYYKKNSKLELFVYKRFEYKMSSLEYTIEVDDISDKSFAITSCFMDYGIGMNIDKSTSYTEKISYTFNFYNDKEIRIQYYENKKRHSDTFLNIREIYDHYTNKDIAVHFICDYVKKIAKDTIYIDLEDGDRYNYHSKLVEVIRACPCDFYSFCHAFTNTEQIREWIIEILHNKETERIIEHPIRKSKFDRSIVFR